jgi:hypothetical protein
MKLSICWEVYSRSAGIEFPAFMEPESSSLLVKSPSFTPIQNEVPRHEDVWGSEGIVPQIFLNLGITWR